MMDSGDGLQFGRFRYYRLTGPRAAGLV
jgi:hypothetical protein